MIYESERRIFCERLIDGRWIAVKKENGIIANCCEVLNNGCVSVLYNIANVWEDARSDILGDELKSFLGDVKITTLRFSELILFINQCREGMYAAVTLETLRNLYQKQISRESFDEALDSYSALKSIERDVLVILGETPEYVDYSDIRIVWAQIDI